MLRAAAPQDREVASSVGGYSLHQLQGDKQHGVTRSGYLLKKSEGKVRRVWQKRRCRVAAEGYLDIFHADENKPPARVNLLTCQIKVASEDKRAFDLVSYNRTYHFQAEDEGEQRAWTSVLVNCKEGALLRAFHQQAGDGEGEGDGAGAGHSLLDLQRAIIRAVRALPGNHVCADCGSANDPTWLSTNFGIIVCIECSGSHRELGVHISRIQSLTLDKLSTSQLLLARHMGNQLFNEVMENTLDERDKLTPESTMEERLRFIREKYVYRAWAARTCRDAGERQSEVEHAVNNAQLHHLLQAYAEGADLAAPLPRSDCGETALHLAISRELGDGSCLHIVDFLVQNGGSQLLDKTTTSGMTALHLCAMFDRTEPMKLLLKAGADVSIRDGSGRTALQRARQLGHHACQELLDKNRNVSNALCTCKAGLGGKCKHICALIHYVNSPESSSSKTSHFQEWGKPTQRQLLGYDKGQRMSRLFTPQPLCREALKLEPVKITTANLPNSFANTPLAKMLKLEEKENIVVTPAESLLKMIQMKTKQTLTEKVEKVVSDIFLLQSMNQIYSEEVVITQDLYTFYKQYVYCDFKAALNLSVLTIQQSNSNEWFKQRTLRITASNGYKLKGHRFNVEKVVTDLLNPKIIQNAAMIYGKKNEDVALKEYKQFVDPSWEVVKVGVIINLQQPWLSCSPDAILVYGKEAWQKQLVEIKCPYTCRKLPVWDIELGKPNVPYLKRDENGLHLNPTHSIYIQVQLQMYVTNIGFCHLFIYSPQGSMLLNIQRDNQLLAQLIPHLEQFYFSKYIQRLHAKYCTN